MRQYEPGGRGLPTGANALFAFSRARGARLTAAAKRVGRPPEPQSRYNSGIFRARFALALSCHHFRVNASFMNLVGSKSPTPLSADPPQDCSSPRSHARHAARPSSMRPRFAICRRGRRAAPPDLDVYCRHASAGLRVCRKRPPLRDFGLGGDGPGFDADHDRMLIDEIADFLRPESGSGGDHRGLDARRNQGLQRKPDAPRGAS